MDEFPNFTAYEINALRKRARKSEYHQKCLDFVDDFEEMSDVRIDKLTEKQKKWLWGIKLECMELLDQEERI